jgi:lysylphosphatidylglycerol synthetase-like protein (DUF2156 family)
VTETTIPGQVITAETGTRKKSKTPAGKAAVQKTQALSQTMMNLRLSRSELSNTLRTLKLKQESFQSSSKAATARSATGQFRVIQLQKYGTGSMAYSSLQPGMQYFMHTEYGYTAFVPLGDAYGSVCVLADPICSPENMASFLDAFLKERNDPIFLHISHDTAKHLAERGFCVNELGVETLIDIQEFTLVGTKKEQLRRARNNAQKDSIKVREIPSVDDALFKAFKKIADEWIRHKVISDNEMQFIVRPIVYVDEVDVRRFVALKDNEIVGYVIFDPMYENGEVIGYIANHLRSILDRSYSVVDYIIIEALETFKQEGKRTLSLGLSPLAKVNDDDEFKHSKLIKAHFQYAFKNANFLYNFKNLYQHKTKYRPESPGAHEEKVYCAMRTRFLLVRACEVYQVLGIDLVNQIFAHIKRAVKNWFLRIFRSGDTEQPENLQQSPNQDKSKGQRRRG